jgi:hypothetical protein
VKRVEATDGLGTADRHHIGNPSGRVGANVGERGTTLRSEFIEEPPQGALVATLPGPDQPLAVVVYHYHKVALPLAKRHLIDPIRRKPASRSCPWSRRRVTRTSSGPIVRQEMRISAATAVFEHSTASQAVCSRSGG